jgi:hypothetical protein
MCPDGSAACPRPVCVSGQCQIQYPTCLPPSPGNCASDGDCAAPAVCQHCADGFTSCDKAFCDASGKCQVVPPGCPQPPCMVDSDCPQPASTSPCQTCPNGQPQCPNAICVGKQCQLTYPKC